MKVGVRRLSAGEVKVRMYIFLVSKLGSEDGAGGFVTVMEPVSPIGRVKRVAILSSNGL